MIKTIKHLLVLFLYVIGFSASTICAIHCALMPFLILFLPLIGMEFISDPLFEYLFIGISVVIGTFTFRHGYFNHHKSIFPFLLFLLGLTIIFGGHYLIHDHSASDIHQLQSENIHSVNVDLIIAPFGAILIGVSHYINRKLSIKKSVPKCNC